MARIPVPNPDQLILTSIDLVVPDQMNRSEWTSRGQVVGLPGAEMWSITAELEALATEKEERPWRAFIFNLRGRQNFFYFPLCKQRHIGPRPRVAAGASHGYGLPLEGMTPSTRILEAGQYLTVPLPSGHQRTAMLTQDLVTDAAGKAVATLNIALGEVPFLASLVESAAPFIPVRSSENRASMGYSNAVSSAQFSFEEAL